MCRARTAFGFFFSSRRRHTRWPRDWSSDVCSSDLDDDRFPYQLVEVTRIDLSATEIRRRIGVGESVRYLVPDPVLEVIERAGLYQDRERIGHDAGHREIGRASCRGGGESGGGSVRE